MTKKFVSMFLALAMCLSLATPAFAAEEVAGDEEIIFQTTECNHPNKKFLTSGIDFVNYMSMGHCRIAYTIYQCTSCGKWLDREVTKSTMEAHTMKDVGYTGNNYHSGGKHFKEYKAVCIQCDYFTTWYESYVCPDGPGGGCEIPIGRVILPSAEE